MVSLNPNTPEESDPTAMAVPGNASFSSSTAAAAAAVSTTSSTDDPAARVRKPYTITKSRESWTEPEHDKFMEAIQLFDRDWRKIEAFIGSKSAIQIRSHAQKYFLKAQKSGTGEHIPPPRPKRKAARPYPQKASKVDPVVSQVGGSFQTSPVLPEPEISKSCDSSPVPWSHTAAVSSGSARTVQAVNSPHATKGDTKADGKMETTAQKWSTGNTTGQGNHGSTLKVLPDFAEVYNFIGSVFDPDASDHLRKLKKMDPIDVETVLLLVRNLSINLTSPHFEEHRRLLSSYEVDDYSCGSRKQIQDTKPDNSGLGHFG